MKQSKPVLILAALLGLLSVIFFPHPDLGFKTSLSIALMVTTLQLGAMWFFLDSTKTSRTKLRVAYIVLAAAMAFMALAQLQLPVLAYLDAIDSKWVTSGVVLIPYVLTVVGIFTAMRLFMRISGVRTRFASVPLLLAATVLVGFLVSILPHVSVPTPEVEFDLYQSLLIWTMVFIAGALQITLTLRQTLSITYRLALTRLVWALGALIGSGLHELWYQFFLNINHGYTYYSIWPQLVVSVFFLAAGEAFNDSFRRRLQPGANYLDVIHYVISLISDPSQVDVYLDEFRHLTTTLDPDKPLTRAQKSILSRIYLKLEDYLVQREPLRKFSVEDLREQLPDDFRSKLGDRDSPSSLIID